MLELPATGYFMAVDMAVSVPRDKHARTAAVRKWLQERKLGDRRVLAGQHWKPSPSLPVEVQIVREWETTSGYRAQVEINGSGVGWVMEKSTAIGKSGGGQFMKLFRVVGSSHVGTR